MKLVVCRLKEEEKKNQFKRPQLSLELEEEYSALSREHISSSTSQ